MQNIQPIADPQTEIALNYQLSRAKRVFVLTFCLVVSFGAWAGAWASHHWYFDSFHDVNFGTIRTTYILVGIAAVYTFFMLPIMV